ncbi:hypothetical protein P879_06179 [Paragonimus westermani]|uniref:Uncharacterized protein n=1 Tax=Paragonimus westermani TaxID=34504 RepID=A0A8T0DND3_9TREM|nr:hypothetical protein P879_06179 [Paragonimus westermani]
MWCQSKDKKQARRDRTFFGLTNQMRTAHTIVCHTHGTATTSTIDQRNKSVRLGRYRIGTVLKFPTFILITRTHAYSSVILFEQSTLVCQ